MKPFRVLGLTRRKLIAGVVIAFSLGALPSSAALAQQTALSFFSWDGEQVMRPLIDAFEAENPDVKVEYSTAPPVAEYIQTLQTRLLSHTAADVFVMAAENKTSLIQGGFVKDLTSYDFVKVTNPVNQQTYGADGKVYALSLASWGGGILYNKELVAKVGMTEPPKSWDEFLALCKKLKDAGIVPYYDGVQSGNMMPLYALVGLHLFKQGGNVDQAIFSGKDTFANQWTAPLTIYSRLYSEGLVSKDVLSLTDDQIVSEFATGKVAMMGAGPWNLGGIRGINPKIDMTFMAVPGPDAGDSFLTGAPSPGYAINAETQNMSAAEKFLAFLASAKAVEMYHKSSGAITTTSNYTPDLDPALDVIYAGLKEQHIYLPVTSWPRAQDSLRIEMVARIQELVSGSIQPADVAKALDAKLAESQ